MDFNDLLQAGTGLLQGKTQGELFERQQEERRINALATQMHNTIEMARAQDLLQTSALNRQVTLNADRRADAGEARAQAGFLHEGRDIPYQQFVELGQRNTLRGNELLRSQDVGFAREDAANFARSYEQQTGRAPGGDVALMGGRVEMLPGGTPMMIPNLQSDAARRTAEAQATLHEHNATVAGIEATRAGMVWEAEAPRLLTDIQRQLSVQALKDEADGMTALRDRTVAELEWKITQDTSEAAQRLAVADALSKLEAMLAFGQMKVNGQIPEWLTPEMFLEQQGLVFEHELRMDEIAGQAAAQAAAAAVPRTTIHHSYSHADPRALELGFAEVGARNFETEVRQQGIAADATGDGPPKASRAPRRPEEEEMEENPWGEMP